MENTTAETATNIKCMCGHIIPESEVVFVNPQTKAITWTQGFPYCKGCVPASREDA